MREEAQCLRIFIFRVLLSVFGACFGVLSAMFCPDRLSYRFFDDFSSLSYRPDQPSLDLSDRFDRPRSPSSDLTSQSFLRNHILIKLAFEFLASTDMTKPTLLKSDQSPSQSLWRVHTSIYIYIFFFISQLFFQAAQKTTPFL